MASDQRPPGLAPARENRLAEQQRELAAEQQREAAGFGTLEVIGGTFLEDTTIGVGVRAVQNAFTPDQYLDPDWLKTFEQNYDALMEGVPPEYQVDLADADSYQSFIRRKSRLMESLQFDTDVASSGANIATRIAANFLEPTAYATGGILSTVGVLNRGTRLQRALKIGAVAGVENAALEAYLAANNDVTTTDDILLAGLVGLTVGGAIGGLTRGETLSMKDAVDRAATEVAQREAREAQSQYGTQPEGTPGETPADTDETSVGARQVGPGPLEDVRSDEALLRRLGMDDEALDAPEVAWAANPIKWLAGKFGRWDIAGVLGRDEDEAVRRLTQQLVEEPVALVDGTGKVVPQDNLAASERRTQLSRLILAGVKRPVEQAFKRWAIREGAAKSRYRPSTVESRDAFFSKVGRALRGFDDPDPEVQAAVKAYADTYETVLKELKEAGVRGFEDVEFNRNYLPRVADHNKIAQATQRYGAAQIQRAIAQAMRENIGDALDPAHLKRLASGYWKRLRSVALGVDSVLAHGINLRDHDVVRQILREADGITDAEIDQIIDELKHRQSQESKGGGSRAKHRADLNELSELKLRVMDGPGRGTQEVFHVADLFENNAELLTDKYVHSMTGWVALARSANIRSEADFRDTLAALASRSEGMGSGRQKYVKDSIQPRLEFLYNYLTGTPITKGPLESRMAEVTGLIRDLNFMRTMGQAGYSAIAEVGQLIAYGGFRSALAAIPNLGKYFRDARTGRLGDENARVAEEVFGLGSETFVTGFSGRMEVHDLDRVGLRHSAEGLVAAGRNIVADFSGLGPLTSLLQRWTAGAVTQRWLDIAQGKQRDYGPKRIAVMGFTESRWADVKGDMLRYMRTNDRGTRSIDWDRWKNESPDTFAATQMAVFRIGRRAVQENDVGATAVWMHTWWGRTLAQFRSFILGSYTKQLLHGIQTRDMTAWSAMMASTLFAGVGYTARTYVNYANDKEKLEERLDPWRVVGQSLYGSSVLGSGMGAASWLFNGTGAREVLPDELQRALDIERSTNIANDLVGGIPTVDLLKRLTGAAQTAGETIGGHPVTDGDVRNLQGLLPILSNISGARLVQNAINDQLPDRDPFDRY